MRTIKKIMDIPDRTCPAIGDTPVAINICNVKHSLVHYHQALLEMVLCVEGTVSIRCNEEIVTLKKGQLFTIGFNDIHCLYSDTDNIVIVFHININHAAMPVELLKCSSFACEDFDLESYQIKPMHHIKDIILATVYTYTKFNKLDSAKTTAACNTVADLLLKYFDWNNKINLTPNVNDELRQRFRAVLKYCEKNYMKRLTISQLAAAVHINENYLSQFMHKSGHGSFSNLIGYMRCFYAQYLLLTTEMSIIQIADKCGFSDVKYFYKYFKNAWKQTPQEFRQWFVSYLKEDDFAYYYSSDEIIAKVEPFIAEFFSNAVFERKLACI